MKKISLLLAGVLTVVLADAQFVKRAEVVKQKPGEPVTANWAQALRFESEIEKFGNDLNPVPYFINDSDRFWYRMRTSDGTRYFMVDPKTRKKSEFINAKTLTGKISMFTHKAYNAEKFDVYNLKFDKKLPEFIFDFDGERYSYNYQTETLKQLPKEKPSDLGSSSNIYSPDSLYYIYAKDHDLYMRGNEKKGQDSTEVRLTTDGNRWRSYSRYPDEETRYTIPNGRWFKNSKKFLIQMEDMSKCDMMYLVDMCHEPRPKLKEYRYCCPGDTAIGEYTLSVLDIKTRKITPIHAEKWKDQYVEYAYDNKNGDRLYIYRTKRSWDEKELCLYDVPNDKLTVLFNEVDKPYFDYVIAQTHFINDGREIILRSERTGYGHFYLYNGLTGKFIKPLTSGNWVTGQVDRIDTLKRDIYFYAFGREKDSDPYYYKLYRTNMDRGGCTLLTPEEATHKIMWPKSFNYFVDTYSTVSTEPRTRLKDRNGKVIMELERGDFRELYAMGWRKPERFKVKAADGTTDIYGVMWKPMDFDSTRHYPIISEVYPGPQFEYVPTAFGLTNSHATQLAQLGFIVIQVGHRGGTPMRGKFYHRAGYKNLRDYALADDVAAITELARRYPYINAKKVGIFGHSGGGFMSTAALCQYPEFYTAAVSSAGNHDNRIYNTGWIEMNNGVEEIRTVKRDTLTGDSTVTVKFKPNTIQTNLDLAKNYKGHLLLVHGLMDDNVHPAHTMRMAKALMKAGKNFDMILLPQSTHGFSSDESKFFERKMWRHFTKYLLNDVTGEYQSNLNQFYEKTKE